jgi:hypothetical protein
METDFTYQECCPKFGSQAHYQTMKNKKTSLPIRRLHIAKMDFRIIVDGLIIFCFSFEVIQGKSLLLLLLFQN